MIDFFSQYNFNTFAGPDYVTSDDLPVEAPTVTPVRLIAYYLPQFHSIAENDQWWGQGFTEWTNVTKALPRYDGHLQPRLPADLGFYNLTDSEVIKAQAALAKRAGIAGFCIHDYWFSGRKVLERPLQVILENPSIDLPFCLNWANENWSRRWDGSDEDILLQQRYDPEDKNAYVRSILPVLRDRRYIKVDSRPLIMIYRPELIPDIHDLLKSWRSFLISEGVGNPYLVMAQSFDQYDPRTFGMDAAAGFPPHGFERSKVNDRDYWHLFDLEFRGQVRDYLELARQALSRFSKAYVMFPGVCPGWDNEARRPRHGNSFRGATPNRYGAWLFSAVHQVLNANSPSERIVFINAWNEWAEGAILEPDRHYGHAFLCRTRMVLDAIGRETNIEANNAELGVKSSRLTRVKNIMRRKGRRALRFIARSIAA